MNIITVLNLIIGIIAICGGAMIIIGTILKRRKNGKSDRKA